MHIKFFSEQPFHQICLFEWTRRCAVVPRNSEASKHRSGDASSVIERNLGISSSSPELKDDTVVGMKQAYFFCNRYFKSIAEFPFYVYLYSCVVCVYSLSLFTLCLFLLSALFLSAVAGETSNYVIIVWYISAIDHASASDMHQGINTEWNWVEVSV